MLLTRGYVPKTQNAWLLQHECSRTLKETNRMGRMTVEVRRKPGSLSASVAKVLDTVVCMLKMENPWALMMMIAIQVLQYVLQFLYQGDLVAPLVPAL